MSTAAAPAELSLEQAARLRSAVLRMSRRLRHQAHGDITPSQLAVLGTLERQGAMTLGDLAQQEALAPPNITRIVRALEEAGLTTRATLDHDRRSAHVTATAKGRRLIQTIRAHRNAWLAERVAELTPRELGDLERGLSALERILGAE